MVIILFGVTGSGKTTIGQLLAATLSWKFYDADDFHPEINVEKMRKGIPLEDVDRGPWLDALRHLIKDSIKHNGNVVLACSALKESYRDFLCVDDKEVKFVHLKGDFALIQKRLSGRTGHYMNPLLLQSQFNALEEPTGGVLEVDISPSPPVIVHEIRTGLRI